MSHNLPAKSNSRGIQQRHVRHYANGKTTIVNKEINKQQVKPLTGRKNPFESRIQPRRRNNNQLLTINNRTPKITFPPKKRDFIRNKEDLWEALKKLELFNDTLGFYNNNIELLKEELYEEYKNQLSNFEGDQDKAVKQIIKDRDDYGFDDAWGGADQIRITKFGNWKNNKDLDSMIQDDETWSLHHDPFEGQLFTPNKEWKLDWDAAKWKSIELDNVNLGEMTLYDPDEAEKHDHLIMKTLNDHQIPFLHAMPGQGYNAGLPAMLLFPRNYDYKVKELLNKLHKTKEI